VRHDYQLNAGVPGVAPVSEKTAEHIKKLHPRLLSRVGLRCREKTWASSVCIWQGDRWDALIDLWSLSEGRSDLVLSLQISEAQGGFEFVVYMVYVP
jgi:hypothetical protein